MISDEYAAAPWSERKASTASCDVAWYLRWESEEAGSVRQELRGGRKQNE